jgi:RimJ/RimL family protein N-acetyltransferase
MLFLHRATRRFIDLEPLRRLEASVEVGFPAGERWLELLGFEHEGPLRAFGANGEDHVRYARIQR